MLAVFYTLINKWDCHHDDDKTENADSNLENKRDSVVASETERGHAQVSSGVSKSASVIWVKHNTTTTMLDKVHCQINC